MAKLLELLGMAQVFFDLLPGAVSIKDHNLNYVGLNGNFAAFFNKQPEEIIGQSDESLIIQDEDAARNLELEKTILASKESYLVRELIKPKEGKILPVLSKKAVIVAEKEVFLVSFTLVEEDLQKEFSHVKYHHTLNVLDQLAEVFVCWKDENSVFRGCNQNFADLVGKTKDEIIGIRDPFNESHIEDDTAIRKAGKPRLQYDETIPDPSGEIIHIRTNKGVWKDAEGKVIGTIATFNKTS